MHADMDYRAVLIADCGIECTRVTLVDVVGENEYRLVAQRELATTVDPPVSDVTVPILQAVIELERTSGRRLLEGDRLRIPQSRDGQGLDAFVATCSAGGSLPVLVLAVTADITAQTAALTVEGTYAVPFRVVTMEEILRDDPLALGSDELSREPWWRAVESLYPGGLLIVGGVEGGNISPLRTLARNLAEALPPKASLIEQEVERPVLPVIYAGNSRAREVVQQYLEDRVDLRIVENVRPSLREERLLPARQEIVRLYEELVLQRVPGYEELASWAQSPVQLPYLGAQLAARFLAAHHQRMVQVVDLGSASTTVVCALGDYCERVVLGHFGLGYGVGRILARRGVARLQRWLPYSMSEEQVRDWVLNRALRPRTLPVSAGDFLMQQALAREALAEALAKFRKPCNAEMCVLSGGGLAKLPRKVQAVLVALDALQPNGENVAGLVDLYEDRHGLLPSIGALATLNPDAAACVLLNDGLSYLGPCLVPLGRVKKGARALTVELESAGGWRHQADVAWGQVVTIPFNLGEQAHLTVKPARGTRLGLGRSGEQLTTKGGEMIPGGSLGLIIDARGRPLELPQEEAARQGMLQEWLEQIGAFTAEELESAIPVQPVEEEEELLEEPAEELATAD